MTEATTQHADKQRPWIGLASFTEGDREFFAGRGEEVDDLMRLLRRDPLTLLYGVSGLGKTSLLNAGVFPAARAENYLPIPIRLDHHETAPALAAQVLEALVKAVEVAGVEAPHPEPQETLWEYFHREGCNFWGPRNDLVTPFLAFDQFEELFTLGRETPERARRGADFIKQLGDLVENRAPDSLREEPARARQFTFKAVPLRVLLSMREDYLADLDRIRAQFRTLGLNRLRLLPMGRRQARQVIDLGQSLLEPGVADRILAFASGAASAADSEEDLAVAPALLSLVLRELNERRLEKGADARINADLLDVEQAKILQNFYLRTLQGHPVGVRHFIEDELLTATGYRNSCALDDALTCADVTQPVLNALVDQRLLAYEDRHHARRVEITHDVLAPIIKASRDTRLTQEALDDAERRRVEAREKERIARRRVFILAALLVLSAAFGIYGWVMKSQALASKQKVEKAQQLMVKEMIEASWKAGTFLQAKSSAWFAPKDEKAEAAFQAEIDQRYKLIRSWLPGARSLYLDLKAVMDLEKLQSLAPMKIFLSGPHGKDFNVRSNEFGHYNPDFVQWAATHAIPGASDSVLRGITAPFYQNQLKEIARIYYLAHHYLGENPDLAVRLRQDYTEALKILADRPFLDEMNSGPGGCLQNFGDFVKSFDHSNDPPQTPHTYPWDSDISLYYASTAPGFWIRRQIDGTAPDFFALLTKLLQTYDAAFLTDPKAP